MSNLTETQRSQMESANLADSRQRLSKTGQRAAGAYVGIGLILLAVLSFAAYQAFDGWPSAVVLADIILIVAGLAAWVYPQRTNI